MLHGNVELFKKRSEENMSLSTLKKTKHISRMLAFTSLEGDGVRATQSANSR
jgi:hypothetical protein